MGTEENKKLAKEFTERLGSGDSSVLDELCTEDFTGHALAWGGMEVNKQIFKQTNDMGHRAFPDYSMTVDDKIAEFPHGEVRTKENFRVYRRQASMSR